MCNNQIIVKLGGLRPRVFSNKVYKYNQIIVKLGGLRPRVFSNEVCHNQIILIEMSKLKGSPECHPPGTAPDHFGSHFR